MEQENTISFWKKFKISIFQLENYQKLAIQKLSKTILYFVIIMLIFSLIVSFCITVIFHQTMSKITNYIQENIQVLSFQNGALTIQSKENPNDPIIIDEEKEFNGKIIIDTNDLTEEQISQYQEKIGKYYNGIIVLKNKVIAKTGLNNSLLTVPLDELANEINLVQLQKEDILNFLGGRQLYLLDGMFLVMVCVALWINYFASTLLDALLYSVIGYIASTFARIKLRYTAIYNIASYSMTLPILLNLVYTIVNLFTGYTIHYFDIMYVAVTCVYIFAAIFMIKSDIIKRHVELTKVIEEQEKVKQEMKEREQKKQEEEEKEKLRKEDEKKEKEDGQKEKKPNEKENPEPQANINENELGGFSN